MWNRDLGGSQGNSGQPPAGGQAPSEGAGRVKRLSLLPHGPFGHIWRAQTHPMFQTVQKAAGAAFRLPYCRAISYKTCLNPNVWKMKKALNENGNYVSGNVLKKKVRSVIKTAPTNVQRLEHDNHL